MKPILRSSEPMSLAHELIRPGEAVDWTLAAGAVQTLRIGPGPRWLRLEAGRLWLTSSGRPGHPAQDHVLQAGEALWLPAGQAVVIEAWGPARFSLRVPPQACRGEPSAALQVLQAHGRAAWARVRGAARPAPAAPTALYRPA